MSRSKKKSARRAEVAAPAPDRLIRLQVVLGYAVVALSVIGGLVLAFFPQVVGLHGSNPAIGVGVTAFALFRLWALRVELKRQAEQPEEGSRPAPKRAGRLASPRA